MAVITGGPGDDVLTGTAGNDLLIPGAGHDTLLGGDGWDVADYSGLGGAITINWGDTGGKDRLVGVEKVIGTRFADILRGDAGDNFLAGMGGSDTLVGGAGSDWVDYQLIGRAVFVSLRGGFARGQGHDTLRGIENVDGSLLDDRIIGNAKANILLARAGDDRLTGGGGRDTFMMAPGDDFDTITDFKAGTGGDFLDLTAFGLARNALLAAATQDGADTVLDLGNGDGVRLLGVDAGDLIGANFL